MLQYVLKLDQAMDFKKMKCMKMQLQTCLVPETPCFRQILNITCADGSFKVE